MLTESLMTFDEWQVFNEQQGMEMPSDVRTQVALYEDYARKFVAVK